MTTQTKTLTRRNRLTAWLANRQLRKPRQLVIDPLEARTDSKITLSVFGLLFTSFLIMLAWALIGTPDQFAHTVALFFVNVNHSSGNSMTFDALLKSFGAALIVLINLTLTIFFVAVDEPTTNDVLATMDELDDRIMARLSEINHEMNEKLDVIERNTAGPAAGGDNELAES